MSVKIRLKRFGSKKRPYYRIVVIDSRNPRDGMTLEEVGIYRPVEHENQVQLESDKVKDWLSKGALVTATVKNILNSQNIKLK